MVGFQHAFWYIDGAQGGHGRPTGVTNVADVKHGAPVPMSARPLDAVIARQALPSGARGPVPDARR